MPSIQKENFSMSIEPATDPVVIGGITPLTTIDYPGELSAVLFLQGCPWRCRYCQNGTLIERKSTETLTWRQVTELLTRRRKLLDAVVFSGGEPLLQAGLAKAMHQVKAMGFKIGLHTAGIYPRRLQEILPLIDWVGMDVKASRQDYESITGARGSATRAWQSIEMIVESGVAHEFRTTVHPELLCKAKIGRLADELLEVQASDWVIQECVSGNCLDENLRHSMVAKPGAEFYRQYAERFERFTLRR